MERIQVAHVFRVANNILRGQDLIAFGGFCDSHFRNDPESFRCAERVGIGADAVSDCACLAAAKPERQAQDAISNAGLDDDRGFDPAVIRRNGDDVPGGDSKA